MYIFYISAFIVHTHTHAYLYVYTSVSKLTQSGWIAF